MNPTLPSHLCRLLISVALAAVVSCRLAAAERPLAIVADEVGQELQRGMIWAPADARPASPFLAFRKSFTLEAAPRDARLHLFADARYLLWINGHYVLSGPARFEPDGPEYDSVDVARQLRAGANSVIVLVLGHDDPAISGKMRRHAPGLTARLEVDHRVALVTDPAWRWSDRTRYRAPAIDWANLTDRIDSRVEDGDWAAPDYDDRNWPSAARVDGAQWGPLTARRTPLLRDTAVPASFSGGAKLPLALAAGEKLAFTLPRLSQVYTVLDFTAEDGAEAELALDYASASLERMGGREQPFAGIPYRARAGRQVYVTSDSRGLADGAIRVLAGRVTIHGFSLVERLYPFDVAGSFHSNDEQLNRLWSLCARSCQVLSEDAYVDCADRERVEWMDDDPPGFDITRTALAGPAIDGRPAYADARLLGALLRRTALSVQPEGWVKAHTASDRFDIHAKMEDRACDWVQGARRYLESTGDTALIREIWPVIVRQMDYFLARRTARGLVLAREWVVWGNPVGYVTCEGAGLNAFVFRALADAAQLGHAIGDEATAERFDRAARELAGAFDRVLWDEAAGNYASAYFPDAERDLPENRRRLPKLARDGDRLVPTMFSALWALDQGIVPESRRARVREYLVQHRGEAGRVMTFYYLFRHLYAADQAALDTEILQTLRSKWAGMIDAPWQVSWEEFTGASKAHIYGMFPGYYLSAYVLGVRVDGPAATKRLLVEPRLGDLTQAEGVVVTEFGLVPIAWQRAPGRLEFRIDVPAGTTAALRLPRPADDCTLELDGHVRDATSTGRWLTLELPAGAHRGTVSATTPR
jgi:hypothetical protein